MSGDDDVHPYRQRSSRARLYRLTDEAAASHKQVRITGKWGNAVLILERRLERDPEVLALSIHTGHARVDKGGT